jgi:primosomal protein N' (replication factor Y)
MSRYADVVFSLGVTHSFTYEIPEKMLDTLTVGMRVTVPFGRRTMTGFVIALQDKYDGPYELKQIGRIVDKTPIFGERTIALARWLSDYYLCSLGEALSTILPTGRRESSMPALEFEDDLNFERIAHLSDEQQAAIDTILKRDVEMFYLYGITGSGKSEVFLRVAEAVIEMGRSVIYLVPEITLTHQLAQQVANRFSNQVAVLHSALTPSQRLREWKKIQAGEVRMVIGARSAIFAPFDDLGLIIVDEEHEGSYKSGSTPRYHARQVAQHRSLTEGAILLMGSATPSLEAYRLMDEGDRLTAIHLRQRVAGGQLPAVEVVDMTGQKTMISRRLRTAIGETLANKRQVILFLNRRGFSYFFHCNSCGYELRCPHCDVGLTYHKRSKTMVCHYCGHHSSPHTVCPSCKSVDVTYSGFGTERVEDEVRTLFADARIERLDTDSAQDKKHLRAVIDAFRDGEIDILLGTQMVAKGLNFPLVDLVGIVLADSGLNIPDFRAHERTFSLLVQVSGRAGRYAGGGRVIIQTFHPDNPAIVHAMNGDIDGFYAEELAIRRQTEFPPFSRLANLVIRGRRKEVVAAETATLTRLLESGASQLGVEVLVSNECPMERIASNWRYHILLSSKRGAAIHHLLAKVLPHYSSPSSVYVEIDLDPLHLL